MNRERFIGILVTFVGIGVVIAGLAALWSTAAALVVGGVFTFLWGLVLYVDSVMREHDARITDPPKR